jgi:hypothetical protein
MTIRTYNSKSGEWSIYWTTSMLGVFALLATVGKFDASGRGEFDDHEQINGLMVFVRFLWLKQNLGAGGRPLHEWRQDLGN